MENRDEPEICILPEEPLRRPVEITVTDMQYDDAPYRLEVIEGPYEKDVVFLWELYAESMRLAELQHTADILRDEGYDPTSETYRRHVALEKRADKFLKAEGGFIAWLIKHHGFTRTVQAMQVHIRTTHLGKQYV